MTNCGCQSIEVEKAGASRGKEAVQGVRGRTASGRYPLILEPADLKDILRAAYALFCRSCASY